MGMIYFHTEDGHILEPILSRCSLLAKTTWVFFHISRNCVLVETGNVLNKGVLLFAFG